MTTNQTPETDEQRADREETERAHASGNHEYCGVTCEVEFPTEMLRNGILAKGYPGTAGMLNELLRRATSQPPADRAAVLREAADAIDAAFTGPDLDRYTRYGADLLRRMADEAQPASTAPLAAGLPLVKGNCPACRRASLFLGTGGYPTCSNADCTEPDAASTVLEQYANEAHAPEHTWAAELYDPLADEWVPGTRYPVRERAVNHLAHARTVGPTWKDGSPTRRRLVRATTTYTVEPETEPAAEAQPESCAHCGKDILRVTGTLAVWWVHDPGGNTICFPQQAASSPRATPKPAAETQPAEQPFDRCAACGHTVCDGDGPCGARSGDDFCTCPGPAAEAQQEGAAS